MSEGFQTCTRCKSEKEYSLFPLAPRKISGRGSHCSTCCYISKREKMGTLDGRMKEILQSARSRAKTSGKGCTLTLENLHEMWNSQNGQCAVTNDAMDLATYSANDANRFQCISLDRIDSEIGYHVGNVQFITFQTNLAKNIFTMDQLMAFCKKVVQYE